MARIASLLFCLNCIAVNGYRKKQKGLMDKSGGDSQSTGACSDTPGWTNGHGFGCDAYSKHWCAAGDFKPGFEWTGSASQGAGSTCATHLTADKTDCAMVYNYPAINCCVCGKSTQSTAQSPTATCGLWTENFENGPGKWVHQSTSHYYTGSECYGGTGSCWKFTGCTSHGDLFSKVGFPSGCGSECTLTYQYKGMVLAGHDTDGIRGGRHSWWPHSTQAIPPSSDWKERTIKVGDLAGAHFMFETYAGRECVSYLDNIVVSDPTQPCEQPSPQPTTAPHTPKPNAEATEITEPNAEDLVTERVSCNSLPCGQCSLPCHVRYGESHDGSEGCVSCDEPPTVCAERSWSQCTHECKKIYTATDGKEEYVGCEPTPMAPPTSEPTEPPCPAKKLVQFDEKTQECKTMTADWEEIVIPSECCQ